VKSPLMTLAITRSARPVTRASPLPTALPWARFGDDLVVFGPSLAWRTAAARADGRLPRRGRRRVSRERLHVVVQNGRLFQRLHPRVPVLLDRGRFLLVDLDPHRARQLGRVHPTCYGVMPLGDHQIVFDVVEPSSVRRERSAAIETLLTRLERPRLEATLTHVGSLRTRLSTSPEYRTISTWAKQQLVAAGYRVTYQAVTVNGKPSRNVIANKRGRAPDPRGVVVVTAHLDSINLTGGAAAAAPGADDNGSGAAGLLEMARVLAGHPVAHDLRLILFGGEEQGLFGSRRYVASLPAAEKRRLRAVLNMDMIGSLNSERRTVLLEGAPLSQAIMDELAAAAAAHTTLLVERSLNPFASDHVPFIEAGVPAVLTIEGADNANHRIHSGRDTLDHIDYDLALDILRMNVAFVAGRLGSHAGSSARDEEFGDRRRKST
jgi:Peptidase family M28